MKDAPDAAAILAPAATGATRWVLAIMTALATLGMAAALVLAPAAAALSGQLAGRATVQIVSTDPIERREDVRAVRDALRDAPYVRAVRTVPEEELTAMAAAWLGDGVRDTGLPLPALIDIDLVGETASSFARVDARVRAVAPGARTIAHASWLAPVVRLMSSAGALAAGIALSLLLSAAAVAALAARATLAQQRTTIDILHLVGATDRQVVRMFQRHAARDAAIGAAAGALVAGCVGALIAVQSAGLTSGLVTASDHAPRYLLSLCVPPVIVIVAIVAARLALLRALRAMP